MAYRRLYVHAFVILLHCYITCEATKIIIINMYTTLTKDLSSTYSKVTSINLSMGALGIMNTSCDSFLSLLQDLNCEEFVQKRIAMKTINIAIRSS